MSDLGQSEITTAVSESPPVVKPHTDLVERCLERRWGVPNESRRNMISQLVSIVECGAVKDRDRVRAFRALLEAEKLDLDAIKTAASVAAIQKLGGEITESRQVVSDLDLIEGAARLLDRPATVLPTISAVEDDEYEVA